LPVNILKKIFFKSLANDIYIHTDNQVDYQALKNHIGSGNFSVSTNLHALKDLHSTITFEYMTSKRTLKLMENTKNICVVNRIKTKERLKKYIFSLPINLFIGRRLYQNIEFPPLTLVDKPNSSINLATLFTQKPDAKILITKQISYGDKLDAQLAKLPEKNKVLRNGGEHEKGIIDMFLKGRTEFSLLYPQQAFTFITNKEVRSYAIESIEPYVLGHLMCTKNAETREFIKKIDLHLSTEINTKELLDIHLEFINPNDKTMFTHYFLEAF